MHRDRDRDRGRDVPRSREQDRDYGRGRERSSERGGESESESVRAGYTILIFLHYANKMKILTSLKFNHGIKLNKIELNIVKFVYFILSF